MALTELEIGNLRIRVRDFLDTFPEWAVIATDEAANYGSGLCADASADLVSYLGHERPGSVVWLTSHDDEAYLAMRDTWRAAHPDYPADAYRAHAVALFDDWVVDLTARQFDPKLPFPWFWRCP